MQTIILGENCLDPKDWEKYECENVITFLMEKYEQLPENLRIYKGAVCVENDITPDETITQEELDKIKEIDEVIYVVILPGDPVTAIIAIVAVVAVAAAAFLLTPSVPNIASRSNNTNDTSSNNELSERTNKARPNGRIPDIFGQVRSTPDLLAVPYKVFESNVELEIAYMCIGRGEYDIEDVKDGDTLVSEVSGASAYFYKPFTSPNSGDSAQLSIGDQIQENVINVSRINEINGQLLKAPNSQVKSSDTEIKVANGNQILVDSGSGIDFTEFFDLGDNLDISGMNFTNQTMQSFTEECTMSSDRRTLTFTTFNPLEKGFYVTLNGLDVNGSWTQTTAARSGTLNELSGYISNVTENSITFNSALDNSGNTPTAETDAFDVTIENGTVAFNLNNTGYSISSITENIITLDSPETVDSDWTRTNLVLESTGANATLESIGDKWIGPFTLDSTTLDEVFINIVAQNGLYKDSGSKQFKEEVEIEVELTPIDLDGNSIGASETFQQTILGSSVTKDQRAITIKFNPTFTGRSKVRLRRITETDYDFNGTVTDDVKVRDLYIVSPVSQSDFGNVTTVHTKTIATTGALSLKERKLNCLVTRKIPQKQSDNTFSSTLYATKSADEIISAICLDEQIGNRNISELDLDSIYDTVSEIKSHFGQDDCGEFSYTFDKDNLSFEETVFMVAEAIYSTAYRQGNLIKLNFERPTENSKLIFNHRNKAPGSEARSVRFGNQNNHDGIELEYVDPEDDAIVTYYIPEDRSAINPKSIETIGVRSFKQAFFHAHRAMNKIKHQNMATQFESTQEGSLAILKDRILVADNTRPNTQDGQIEAQNGLELTLSQNIELDDDKEYCIHIQYSGGSTEAIDIEKGSESNKVILQSTPTYSIIVDDDLYSKSGYIIVENENVESSAFLVTEKDPNSNYSFDIKAVNYSDLYYQQDQLRFWQDFKNNSYQDKSYVQQGVTFQNDASIVTDEERGSSYDSGSNGYQSTDVQVDNYCFSAWLKPSDNGVIFGTRTLILAPPEDEIIVYEHLFKFENDAVIFEFDGERKVAAFVEKDIWTYVSLNYDSVQGTIDLYINGEKVDSGTDITASNYPLELTRQDFGNFYKGRINDLRLYSSYISKNLISEIYRSTK